jgi:hypothetical protein
VASVCAVPGDAERQRLLYYFTSVPDLNAILRSRAILGMPVDTLGALPRLRVSRRSSLVWLNEAAELHPEQARGGAAIRPGFIAGSDDLVRVTVAVVDAQYWPRWARSHWVSRRRRRALDAAAGGLSGTWWLVPHEITPGQWLRIDRIRGGRIWPMSGRHSAEQPPAAAVPSLTAFRRPSVDWPVPVGAFDASGRRAKP